MNLVFASNNAHKLEEVKAILAPSNILIKSLNEIGFLEEIEEIGMTFHENAAVKVNAIYLAKGINCFADDSGLEVEAVNNQPGVFSARYAGEHGNHEANNQKLLKELEGKSNRKACFKTVIALLMDGKIQYFEGRVDGVIAEELSGNRGFGYDPLFIPDGYDRTFADMPAEIKNSISHRKQALEAMLEFLNQCNQ